MSGTRARSRHSKRGHAGSRRGERRAPTAAPHERLLTVVEAELEIVTPVHIGANEPALPPEYVSAHGQYARLDLQRLFAELEARGYTAALDRLAGDTRFDVDDFLYRESVPLESIVRYRLALATRRKPRPYEPIRPLARERLSQRPLIPGSSLKGALTSGLLWLINAEARDPNNPLWVSPRFKALLGDPRQPPDDRLVRAVLGGDPHQRLSRLLRVPDVTAPATAARLYHSGLVHCEQTDGRGYAFSAGRGGHTRRDTELAATFIEALAPETTLPISLEFDAFLTDEATRQDPGFVLPEDAIAGQWFTPGAILSGCQDLAYNTLYQELHHAERLGYAGLIEATRALFERCQGLPDNAVMLRFGWGINWHGVTGYLWDEATAKRLHLPRREYSDFPFPKSRRVVYSGYETPLGTPGWAILRVTGQSHRPAKPVFPSPKPKPPRPRPPKEQPSGPPAGADADPPADAAPPAPTPPAPEPTVK